MAETKPKNAQYSFAINAELRADFISKAKKRRDSGVDLLTKFVEAYVRGDASADPPPFDCPVCGSKLNIDGERVEVVVPSSTDETIKIPAELRGVFEEFLKFATAPTIEDKGWSEALLKVFRDRLAEPK